MWISIREELSLLMGESGTPENLFQMADSRKKRHIFLRNTVAIAVVGFFLGVGIWMLLAAIVPLGFLARTFILSFVLAISLAPLSYYLFFLSVGGREKRDGEFETLRIIYDSTLDGIIVADVGTGRFLEVNNAICYILGYSRDELLNLAVPDIHPTEELETAQTIFRQMAEGEVELAKELQFLTKDGKTVYLDVRAKKAFFAGRTCLIGFFRDMTGRRRIEEELRKSQEYTNQLIETANV
ncbi:MAG: PAS domain S-box protein, partial [Gammaproteobacteria bacterium]|nr:PAS domain S-box protein [Gammaproteobacteria bacterium]